MVRRACFAIALACAALAATGCGAGDRGVFVVDVESGERVRIADAGRPVASADGSRVVLHDGDTARPLSPDGARTVSRVPIGSSGDGTAGVAVHGDLVASVVGPREGGGPPRGRLVVARPGTAPRVLARGVAGTPVFSPDGRRIAIGSTSGGAADALRADDGRTLVVRVADGRRDGRRLPLRVTAWLPDRRVVGELDATRPRGDRPSRRLVVRDPGGGVSTLANVWRGPVAPVAPGGRRIAIPVDGSDDRTGSHVALVPLGGRAPRGRTEEFPSAIAWSPDARRIAVTDDVGDGDDAALDVAGADGRGRRRVATFPDATAAAAAWTADGRHVVVALEEPYRD